MPDQHDTHDHGPGQRDKRGRGDAQAQETGSSAILIELREHIPFSVSAVAIGLIVAGAICVLGFGREAAEVVVEHEHDHVSDPARLFFHLFHPAHMLFSAAATTAMFYRYEKKTAKAIVIGIIGAIGVCGISDIIMPHASLLLLGTPAPLHICVWEHPSLALPFAVVGVFVGVAAAEGVVRSTLISHSLHVLASTMASIFYMVGPLGIIAWIDILGKVFLFVVLAVMVPCCLSDIVFPLLLSRHGRDKYHQEPRPH
ncbi:MAG: hypothetical protein JSU86_15760 [Phycisphaerales bacterium]|nr:MAG: hypothetical protein JSU86_15760 [Phycisphaerales bacterium]